MRFANPCLVKAGFDKLVAVAACAGYSLKDKLNAERPPEKSHGTYSVRGAPTTKLLSTNAPIPSPCAGGCAKSCSCSAPEDRNSVGGGNPCATKTPPPKECSVKVGNPPVRDPKSVEYDPRTPAQDQLSEFKKAKASIGTLTTSAGAIIGSKTASITVGQRGTMLLQDFVFLDEMGHFNRERIPERVVGAKGAGAFGQLEITNDITKYCKAGLFKMGKKTPVAVRFSTLNSESGSADTTRDPIGFAIKFYTEEGNWDLVGSNMPVFYIRDPMLFSSLVHSQKRNPVTHLKDADMFWDFISMRPETTHECLLLFSDRGLPAGFRYMHGYGNHTYKLVNRDGCSYYCKFHFKTNQGIQNLATDEAQCLAGTDPDYAVRDLYNAIGRKEFPCWSLYVQIISEDEARCAKDWNPFDATKVWPHDKYRLVPVGRLVLNRNPKNYFSEVEEIAFSPAHLVPGIEPSPDKVLQGRLFAYSDTHRYRLGVNYHQIPVNCPYKAKSMNYQRDGSMCVDTNQDGSPNYYPNFFNGPADNCRFLESPMCVYGEANRYETLDDDNYSQAGAFYRNVLGPEEQDRLVDNIYNSLKDAQPCIQTRVLENFCCVDPDLNKKLKEKLGIVDPVDESAAAAAAAGAAPQPAATSNDNNNRKK